MQNIDAPSNSDQLSAELVKQLRKESRRKYLAGIRDRLGSVVNQMALSPTESAVACGKSPTWAYRKIYDGTFRVISSNGRILIPRSELEHFLGGATEYNPQPRAKIGGDGNGNG